MGNIVFAAPPIGRFQLHDALAHQLLRRGHQVTVLAADPVTHRFYTAQNVRSRLLPLRAAGAALRGLPIDDAALRDCRLAGAARPSTPRLAHARESIARCVLGLLRYFGTEVPDLVFVHQQRSGLHRIVDYVAREFGCDVLHTGDGLLPGTMQWDDAGVDGDSAKARRRPADYEHHPRDDMFLMAALAAVLGDAGAPPLAHAAVRVPGVTDRIGAVVEALRRRQLGPAWRGMRAWRRALPRGARAERTGDPLPSSPFVAVLLQDPRSASIRLDAVDPPSHGDLLAAARAAVVALDSALPIVVVPPPNGLSAAAAQAIAGRAGRVFVCAPGDAMSALTTALAVITINHRFGLAAMLGGTPLLHLGDALWSHAGIAQRSTLDRLRTDLRLAVDAPDVPHRQSFLTRALVWDHVWCNASEPDENGLRGLVQGIEDRVARVAQPRRRLDYRAALWPLTAIGEGRESAS